MIFHRSPQHSAFGLSASARFLLEEDTGENATTGTGGDGDSTLSGFEPESDGKEIPSLRQPVEGEKLPDFSQLGKKTAEKPADGAEGVKSADDKEKGAGGQPEAKATPAKATGKPITEAAKVVADPKAAPAKVEAPAKTEEEPSDKSKEAKSAKEAKILTDEEINALRPKPGVSQKIVEDFSKMRGIVKEQAAIARAAQAEKDALAKQVEELKQSTGKLPEEVEKELEGLRKLSLVLQGENDPRFQAEFKGKIEAVDTKLIGFLKKNGLPEATAKEIESYAKKGNIEAWPKWDALVAKFKNPVDRQETLNMLQERRNIQTERQNRLSELTASREKFQEGVQGLHAKEQKEFAQQIEQASIPLAAANPWIIEQEVPADATAEQKAVIEAANAIIKSRAEAFAENVRLSYSRDPQKTAEVALKAVEADVLREEKAELEKERDKHAARVKELENQLAKVRSAGRMAHVESPSSDTGRKTAATVPEGQVGGDGESAIRAFKWGQRG